MTEINELLNKIQDSANVFIDIPLSIGGYKRGTCIYKQLQPPLLKLIFPPKSLPDAEEINIDELCRLSIKNSTNSIALAGRIQEIENERVLYVVAQEPLRQELVREYFRVAVRAPVQASYTPREKEIISRPWKLEGETVDLSASGVLTVLPKPPLNKLNIFLEIFLPDNFGSVMTLADVVRIQRLRREKFHVAFHFRTIEPRTQDHLIAFCMQQQRKLLRNKVRID